MSKLSSGQKVQIHLPTLDHARANSVTVLSDKQPLLGEVVYAHEDGTVNVIAYDHVGAPKSFQNLPSKKSESGNEIYVSAIK